MFPARRLPQLLFATFLAAACLQAQADPVTNWSAPPYWMPPAVVSEKAAKIPPAGELAPEAVEAVPTAPLAFTGIAPCRVADTRGNGFSGQYGPPKITPAGRTITIANVCGIPAAAQAVSFNFSAVNIPGAGFLVAYPAGGAFPASATMTYNQNTPNLSNAAVVPLGTGGAITVVAAVVAIDLVIDVNGYYAPQAVVNTVNNLSGAVTLAAGSNVSITPSGQTLTVAANGGPGGLLPGGSFGETLRHDGISWVASNALRNDGTDISVSGVLRFPATVRATAGLSLLFHNTGGDPSVPNTFFGTDAGNLSTTSVFSTAFGAHALQLVTGGFGNTAIGFEALQNDQTGNNNTAVGSQALGGNTSGSSNTACGALVLRNNTTGGRNIGLGLFAGYFLTSGDNNMYLGNEGVASESNTIRIGTGVAPAHTRMFVAGVLNSTVSGASVLISGTGQLGIATSSARYKEDIRDMGDSSDLLFELRPVTFRYKGHADDPLQYGLIAEEVEKVLPELVLNDSTGQPQTVLYHELPAMLLNELQKQEKRIEQEDAEIASLRQQLHSLEERLSELSTK